MIIGLKLLAIETNVKTVFLCGAKSGLRPFIIYLEHDCSYGSKKQ